MSKLLKTPIRGGILTLTDREIVVGEGWLGSRNVRRFPLHSLRRLDLQPLLGERVPPRSILLRFEWADGDTIEVHDIGPVAARQVRNILQRLCHVSMAENY